MRRVTLAALVTLALSAVASTALAQAGHQEWVLTASPAAVGLPAFGAGAQGPGLSASASYGTHPSWNLGGTVGAYHLYPTEGEVPAPAQDLVGALATVGYNVDVLVVVPYLSIGVGPMYARSADGGELRGAVRGAAGFDYRFSRQWSAGLQYEVYALTDGDLAYPDLTVVAVRLSWIIDTAFF